MRKRDKAKQVKKPAAKRSGVAVEPAHLAPVRRLQRKLSAKAGKRVSLSATIGEAARRAVAAWK
jgi:hypothetical protein